MTDNVEFNRDCDKWEAILKSHCCTTEEQKVISDCFIRMRDRFETTRLLSPKSQLFSQVIEELGGFRQVSKVIPLIQLSGLVLV